MAEFFQKNKKLHTASKFIQNFLSFLKTCWCFGSKGPSQPELDKEKCFAELFKKAVSKATVVKTYAGDENKTISRELATFHENGRRQVHLENLYQALLTIPPTSVTSERCFSISGSFVTKKRNNLSNKTIDNLCFLKGYYGSF